MRTVRLRWMLLLAFLPACSHTETAPPASTTAPAPSPKPTYFPCPDPTAESVEPTYYRVTVDPAVDATKGPADAPVTVVVFGDFDNEFASKLERSLEKIEKKYGDKLRRVFKHNPLTSLNKQALPAAYATLCAQEQGKFWELHDRLVRKPHTLDASGLREDARAAGLDIDKFDVCFTAAPARADFKNHLALDRRLAEESTARGAPNTFVNGRKIVGAKPPEEFQKVIDEQLGAAARLSAQGIAAARIYDETIKNGTVFEPLDARVDPFRIDANTADGIPGSKVTLVEFGDLESAFDTRVSSLRSEARGKYGDRLVFVFKHYPLSFHALARPAAESAACAAEQGKYWQYLEEVYSIKHAAGAVFDKLSEKYGPDVPDAIYDKQVRPLDLSAEKLKALPAKLGLDAAKFDDCLASGRGRAAVDADMSEGKNSCVRGTPTFFINGRKWSAPAGYTLQSLTEIVDQYGLAN